MGTTSIILDIKSSSLINTQVIAVTKGKEKGSQKKKKKCWIKAKISSNVMKVLCPLVRKRANLADLRQVSREIHACKAAPYQPLGTWMSGWVHHALNDKSVSLHLNNAAYVLIHIFLLKSEILAHARQRAPLKKPWARSHWWALLVDTSAHMLSKLTAGAIKHTLCDSTEKDSWKSADFASVC